MKKKLLLIVVLSVALAISACGAQPPVTFQTMTTQYVVVFSCGNYGYQQTFYTNVAPTVTTNGNLITWNLGKVAIKNTVVHEVVLNPEVTWYGEYCVRTSFQESNTWTTDPNAGYGGRLSTDEMDLFLANSGK